MGAFEQILNSQDATINGSKVSYQPYTTWNALQKFVSPQVQDGLLCTEPMYPDYFQEYSQSNQFGFSTDPLSTRGNNERPLRGAYNINIVSNTSTSAVVTFLLEALISVPPFDYNNRSLSGLVGLNKVIFNFQTTGNFFRMWSHSPASPATINTVALAFTSNPQVIMWLYSPSQATSPYFSDRVYKYDYSVIGPIVATAGTNISSNATATLVSQSFNLDGIPASILVWVGENPANWSVSTSDVALRITQVNIQWETLQNLLATGTEFDLYHITKNNGYNMTWDDYDNYSGSYLMLIPGSSFPLPVGQVVGMGGKRTVQFQVNCTNINTTRTINAFLNVLPIYSGIMNISAGSANTQTNPLTEADVLSAQALPLIEKEALKLGGSGFFSDVGNFLTEKILPIAASAVPYGQAAYQIGKTGLDVYNKLKGRGVSGGGRMKGRGLENESNESNEDSDEQNDERSESDEENEGKAKIGKINTDKLKKQLFGSGLTSESGKKEPKSILKKTGDKKDNKAKNKKEQREYDPNFDQNLNCRFV